MHLRPITRSTAQRLSDADAHPPRNVPRGAALERAIAKQGKRLAELQRVFWADASRALLIVLQGRDAAGKDGTIRHVFATANPQGCQVTSFKAPTDAELRHDFLWRVHAAVPPRGTIGIFNRSHYEDVLVVRVNGLVPQAVWKTRYAQINDFEQMLVRNDVVVLKFFLHISREEQKRRLLARLTDPTKNWKLQRSDFEDRARWPDYTVAYRAALEKCSTTWAPWYVVPSDDRDVRNYLVARTITETLERLGPRYPRADPALVDELTRML